MQKTGEKYEWKKRLYFNRGFDTASFIIKFKIEIKKSLTWSQL